MGAWKSRETPFRHFWMTMLILIDAYDPTTGSNRRSILPVAGSKELRRVIAHFSEKDSGYFYYTHQEQDDVIVRKREVWTRCAASGNSVMAANLLYLGTVFDIQEWKQPGRRVIWQD